MKYVMFLLLLTAASCCHDNNDACIFSRIEDFKQDKDAIGVYSYEVDGEIHFWFHDGATFYDGSEFIYNADCEEVCRFCGFCIPPACLTAYPTSTSGWEVVWEK
ncbi:MAG: hypothetical protein IPN29_05360 [Saprospiraceae bacterium]|nr:hypothetical protein [Saprospiraceae bacterium]